MANSRHVNPRFENRVARAPYNFVPLPERAITDRLVAEPGAPIVRPALPQDRYIVADTESKPVYSGNFECVLTTETLIYIRGLLTDANAKKDITSKNVSDFFSLDGGKTPRIPGSSLRGLFRSLVEIASFSKISDVTPNKQVYRAVDTSSLGVQYRARVMDEVEKNNFVPRVQGGYMRIKEGQWYIQPAREINGTTWCRIGHSFTPPDLSSWPPPETIAKQVVADAEAIKVYNARTVYIQPGPFQYQDVRGGFLRIKYARALRASAKPGPGLEPCAWAESGKMLSKRSEAVIYPPDLNKTWLPLRWDEDLQGNVLSEEDLKNGLEVAKYIRLDLEYRDQLTDQQATILGNPELEKQGEAASLRRDMRGVLRDFQPVFYLVENGKLIFFGHTQMLRLPYLYTPQNLVPEQMRDPEFLTLDLTQAIFGYVGKKIVNKEGPSKTESRAGRVFFSDAEYAGNLAEPLEAVITPKVLSTPKPTTFQHYLEQDQPDNAAELLNFDNPRTHIRGHKLYWQRGNSRVNDIQETDPGKLRHRSQYTSIQPARAGAQFKFILRFENLRQVELGVLAWALRVAGDAQYRLKLGMGKPLGMGTVKIGSSLNLDDRSRRYQNLFDETGWAVAQKPVLESERVQRIAIEAFESWVLSDPVINPNKLTSLAALPRIQDLLTLLAWPGPDREQTRYMEIERVDRQTRSGKTNEYRGRPVLPSPKFVVMSGTERAKYIKGQVAPETQPSQSRNAPRPQMPAVSRPVAPILPPLPEVREEVSKEAQEAAAALRSREISEGDVLQVKVIRITGNAYECSLGEEIKTTGNLLRDERSGLKVGDIIKVKVKRIAFTGTAILTIKGVK